MKNFLLPTLFALGSLTLSAQVPGQRPGVVSGITRPPGLPPGSPSVAPGNDTPRFDLDFPGGTPGELGAAISKATGKHLNLIIPVSHAATKIMPIKVVNVTVSEVFTAIQQASIRQIPVVTGSNGKSKSVQYQNISLSFGPVSGPTGEVVWSFQSTEPTAEDAAALARLSEPEQVCQYFQLAPYLEDHTVEDITTAVETGWKMLGVEPQPKLSFHQETKLLIAVGSAEHVQQIPAVLQQLLLDHSAAVEKVAKAIEETAELKKSQPPGWEKKVEEIQTRMERLGRREAAQKELQELIRPSAPRPRVVTPPK